MKKFLEAQAEKMQEKKQQISVQSENVKDRIRKMRQGILKKAEVEDNEDEKAVLSRDLKDTIALLEAKVKSMELQVKSKNEKIKIYSLKLDKVAEEARQKAIEEERSKIAEQSPKPVENENNNSMEDYFEK